MAIANISPESFDVTQRESRLIAEAFRLARQNRKSLESFPGSLPETRDDAYRIQEAAISAWPEAPCGWKVAMVAEPLRAKFGEERLAGPIFPSQYLRPVQNKAQPVSIIAGGFAAVEAEYIAVLKKDAPRFLARPAPGEIIDLIGSMHIGIELAGSPLASINALGPLAVVSDFGNNSGAILGPAIPDWENRAVETLQASMVINDQAVGSGTAANVPGGPLAAVAFLLFHLQNRNRPMKAGQIISTGATTGIHNLKPGDRVVADFGVDGFIEAVAGS